MQIEVEGETLMLREWPTMDAAVAGVGRAAELVFGRSADLGVEALSLSQRGGGGALVVVGEPGSSPTLVAAPWAGRLWCLQGACVVAVRPQPWAASWRELDTPVVVMRPVDALRAMAVVCEDGVLLLSPELEVLRTWPTDLVTGVEWRADGVRVSQWDADPLDIRFC